MIIYSKVKSFIVRNWIVYIIGFVVILGIKYFYSKADSNELKWILAPTTGWVSFLSGIRFEYVSHVGYVNHFYQFIIAPSCSGVQFMMITIATLIYSFAHRMKTRRGGFSWTMLSIGFAYLVTIFINGFRIILSIYLPLYLDKTEFFNGWMTQEKLHTTIGIVIYFTSLFIIYNRAGDISFKISGMEEETIALIGQKSFSRLPSQMIRKFIPPVFWYFFIALGIPFLNKAYEKDGSNFTEFALLMTGVCMVIIFLICLVSIVRKRHDKRRNSCHISDL